VAERAVLPLIAHRGWQRRFPENTLASVRGALEVGARWVEIDVQLARDRVPFLLHDPDLERMTGVRGPLSERDAGEADELFASEPRRLGARFEREPLARLKAFVELLREFPEAEAFVELKSESIEVFGVDAMLDAVLPVLAPAGRSCRLISFHLGVLRAARERCDLQLGPVLERWSDRASPAVLGLAPDVVFCNVKHLPRTGSIELPRGKLALYEVDDASAALALLERGAAWIETFAVGEMLEALGAPGEGPR
jgi:glycerophosphoryl diester phosphodiesterase